MKRLLPLAIALLLMSVLPRLDAQRQVFTTGTQAELTLARQIGLEHIRVVASEKGIDGPNDLRVSGVHVDDLAVAHTRVQQYFRGIPVFGGEAIAHLGADGEPVGETNDLVSGISVDVTPRLTAAAAIDVAVREYGCTDCLTAAPVASLMILRDAGVDRLVYRVTLTRIDGTNDTAMPVRFVDAHGGFVALAYDNLQTGTGSSLYSGTVTIGTSLMSSGQYAMENLVRRVGTMNWQNSTFNLVRFQDLDDIWQDSAQRAGVDAQYGAEKFLDYLQSVHGRNGIDGSGGPRAFNAHDGAGMITSTVHYSVSYNNAFWNGSYMTYGDGDGFSFTPLVTLDIAGHEMMHGVTQYSAGLIYQGESGALNESWSDVFGALNERHARGENANTWLLGEEAYTPATSGDALRYLTNPHQASNKGYTADDDPDHYSERYTGPFDNGGVHINSGIANKAFYLLAQGGSHHLGGSMTGIGTEAAARIWYSGLVSYMTSNTNFAGARDATLLAAAAIHGSGSPQQQAVSLAWCLVGVGTCPTVQAISVTPNSGMGVTQSFTLQYSDTNGASNLISARVRFGATNVGPGTCTARYNAATGAVGILDDAGVTWNDSGVMGSGTLSNAQCTLNLASSSATPNGNNLTVVLNITFTPSFTGQKQIYMLALNAGGANTGWVSRGTWIPWVVGPAAVSVSPNSGSGGTQAFTLQYADSTGAGNLTSARVRFGASNVGPGTCTARYNAMTGAVGLLDDAGTTWNDTGAIGSGSLANSQCTLNLVSSSATVNGNDLTIVLNITFNASFKDLKQIYMLALSNNGASTGWQPRGTWTPHPAPPVVQAILVSPSAGSGTTRAFTLQYSDTAGAAADLASARVRFAAGNVGPGTCTARYNAMTGAVGLLDNAGTTWDDTGVMGSGTLSNSQCTLNLATSSAAANGNNLTVVLNITFKASFAGAKQIYMLAASAGGGTSGWIQRGLWTVLPPPPPVLQAVSTSPSSGSGGTQAFTLQYSDTAGANDLTSARVRFGGSNVGPGTCTARYNAATGAVGILDDAGVTWNDTGVMGSGSLANSQCTLNLAGSSATANGNNLTVVFAIAFNPSFIGFKQIYMLALGSTGVNSGWWQRGTWNVPGSASSGVFLDSQPGDWIGGGLKRTYTPADGTFSVYNHYGDGVSAGISTPSGWWNMRFRAANSPLLQVGSYDLAIRTPWPHLNNLDVSGNGSGCNALIGRFNVLEIQYDVNGNVLRLAVDFEQHCEDADAALYGALRFNSTITSLTPFQGAYPSYRLKLASSAGNVVGSGLDCGNGGQVCELPLSSPATLNLDVTPNANYLFTGWTGSCFGGRTISVHVNFEERCEALFTPVVAGQLYSSMYWNSLPGATGQGLREVVSPSNSRWTFTPNQEGSWLHLWVNQVRGYYEAPHTLTVAVPTGQVLTPGTYLNASSNQTPGNPLLIAGFSGSSCNSTGTFVIHEIVISGSTVTRLAIDLELQCLPLSSNPPRRLFVSLRYNSTIAPAVSLAVTISGQGQVTISPSGTTCTANCVENQTAGAAVQLGAVPNPGWSFVSWGGDADCADGAVTMSAPISCSATFQQTTLMPDSKQAVTFDSPDPQPAYRRARPPLGN